MRVKSSLKNITTGLIGQIILIITGFISRTVFIRVLGSTYLGISGLFSNILTVFSLAELGVGQAIIYSLYKPIAEDDHEIIRSLMALYSRVYRFLFGVVITLGLGILPFLKYIIQDIDAIPNIRIIYMMYVVNSAFSYLFSYRGTFVTACQKNYIINLVSFAGNIVMTAVQIACLFLFRNYLLYLGIQIFFGIAQNIFIYYYAGKKFPFINIRGAKPLSAEELSKIKRNVGALTIYKIGTVSLNSTDNIIISSFVGIVSVGYYSNYALLSSSVSAFLSTIFGNITASIGNLNAAENVEKRLFLFRVINLATFWLYAVCSICLFICMSPFIHIWIGDEYVLPVSVPLIVAINTYIGGMLFAPFNYRQTMGLFVEGKWRPVISAIINIVASIIFARIWGLPGVLWGTAVARLTTNVWFDPYLVFKRGLGVSPMGYYVDYIIKAIQFVGIGAVCWFVSTLIPAGNLAFLILKAAVAFGMSGGLISLLYVRTEEFQYLFGVFKNLNSIVMSK